MCRGRRARTRAPRRAVAARRAPRPVSPHFVFPMQVPTRVAVRAHRARPIGKPCAGGRQLHFLVLAPRRGGSPVPFHAANPGLSWRLRALVVGGLAVRAAAIAAAFVGTALTRGRALLWASGSRTCCAAGALAALALFLSVALAGGSGSCRLRRRRPALPASCGVAARRARACAAAGRAWPLAWRARWAALWVVARGTLKAATRSLDLGGLAAVFAHLAAGGPGLECARGGTAAPRAAAARAAGAGARGVALAGGPGREGSAAPAARAAAALVLAWARSGGADQPRWRDLERLYYFELCAARAGAGALLAPAAR